MVGREIYDELEVWAAADKARADQLRALLTLVVAVRPRPLHWLETWDALAARAAPLKER